eukprot:CAMPEP_0194588498 /NCGR_PEP_ID=MMETSP0292-20121207/19831_1 /TAXON_ID=39354 /ORGANISM="Heterosigma akashiwo, Strain CCMP2393" /LENGTH=55 /DNA_ID=CAMNT_0039445043 /DNA_START=270 /DNA_END=437 /DNA_ORIENTATION=+
MTTGEGVGALVCLLCHSSSSLERGKLAPPRELRVDKLVLSDAHDGAVAPGEGHAG